jgi:hypothetical protein
MNARAAFDRPADLVAQGIKPGQLTHSWTTNFPQSECQPEKQQAANCDHQQHHKAED